MSRRFIMLALVYFFVLRPSPTKVLGNAFALRLFDVISIILVMFMIMIFMKNQKKFIVKYDYLFLNYLLLTFWSAIGLLTALLFNNSVNSEDLLELTRYVYYFLLMVVGYNMSRYIEIQTYLKHLFIATIISILISILQFYNPLGINDLISIIYTDAKLKDITTGNPRVFGTLYNANWFGVYLSFILSVATAYTFMPFTKEKKLYFLPYFTIVLSILGILLSGSRTAIIVSIVGILVTFVLVFFNKPSYKLVITPLLLITFIVFLSSNVDLNIKRFEELSSLLKSESSVEQVSSANGRIVRMEEALDLFYENPLIGRSFSSELKINAHNSYVTLLYQHGLVGLLIVVFFFIIYFLRVLLKYRKIKNDQLKFFLIGLISGTTSFLVASLSGEYMNAIQLYSIILLCIAISVGYYNQIISERIFK